MKRLGKPPAASEKTEKKPRKKKQTILRALKDAGYTDDVKLLIEPRIAKAMASAATRELAAARREAEKAYKVRKNDLLAEALKKT